MRNQSPYYWPAEWAPQTATWIAWPHNPGTWPDRFPPIPACFQRFILELSRVQEVHVLSGPRGIPRPAINYVSGLPNVTIHMVPTNDCWIRDYGPTFVRRVDDGSLVGVDWKFNAWGGKYPPYDDDARAAASICSILGCPRNSSALYCEGGALESDGQGTLLTTSSVLMSPTRNASWTRSMVETELKRQLGVSKIVWVDGGGLLGDDTDGHIDQLARFVAPDIVFAATSSHVSDPNHAGLVENVRILRNSTSASDQPLTVHHLPTPPPRFIDQRRVPESYCNFLLANDIVIVPTFKHDTTDQFALRLFEQFFPQRRIIPLDASDLIWGLGAFHCASQQQPRSS